ncbi:6-phosphogluconolactonase [Deinococcus arenicola]|uniref:6-phosphogluconolactonase n=1 Tax=Deinococcus arenicola TaxID=2994950 RepID=A0ABU4DQ86_9DEIO|nr:6-phosphogluconolactonase [Deinococcus sp. ZS9-10]MDV6374588.1 6-phosphogluconolactonase [Deinococcus sp. ZS9-10]
MNLRVHPTAQAAADAVAEAFARAARDAVTERGAFHVALSGGSTPGLMYTTLRELPDIPWKQVHIYFGDERSVGPDSPDSNYGAAQRELLSYVPVPAAQIHRMEGERRPLEDAATDYAALLPPQLDVNLLGMGDDGHTASLFPGTAALDAGGRVVANWVPQQDTWRVTMTFPEINAARQRWLLVAGPKKAGALADVQAGRGEHPVSHLTDPVWFVDAAAAGQAKQDDDST